MLPVKVVVDGTDYDDHNQEYSVCDAILYLGFAMFIILIDEHKLEDRWEA